MTQLRFGVNFGYYSSMAPQHWPDWNTLISMDFADLHGDYGKDIEARHNYEPSYHPSMMSVARHLAPGIDKVLGSYSQCMQDVFVFTLLNGKTQGTYLELGCFEPVRWNNTYLLSQQLGWHGVSVDINHSLQPMWENLRPNDTFLCKDADAIDWQPWFNDSDFPRQIDYLQIDIDAGQIDVDVLERLLVTDRRFSVITFEHEQTWKQASAQVLRAHGYELLVENIACKDFELDRWHVFEDWWIDPRCIDSRISQKFQHINADITLPFELFCQPGSVSHLMPAVWHQKDIWQQL